MGRPIKCRLIEQPPIASIFKPSDINGINMEKVLVSLDEVEAIKLVDYMGLYQEEAAERMQVSRQTLGNTLRAARLKIADALINAKALHIGGGPCRVSDDRQFACDACQHLWTGPSSEGHAATCPHCGCTCVHRHDKCRRRASCLEEETKP
jgi:predicted DNA-binding protein (UPF0251 family)